jgi:hypothetical protein
MGVIALGCTLKLEYSIKKDKLDILAALNK